MSDVHVPNSAGAGFERYAHVLSEALVAFDWSKVEALYAAIHRCRCRRARLFLCGNGGSAANAVHLANDFVYGAGQRGQGVRATALTANVSIISCIANDLAYDDVFSYQLAAQGEAGDLLIALSGSGNSENIVRAIAQAKSMGMQSCAIVGYSGGRCKEMSDLVLHLPVHDMQMAEDFQMVVGHMVTQALWPQGEGEACP